MWISTSRLFRTLTDAQVKEFQTWADTNPPPDLNQWKLYHPVCREVWIAKGQGPITDLSTLGRHSAPEGK